MKQTLYGSLALLALIASVGNAFAQDKWIVTQSGDTDAQGITPKFTVIERKQKLSATRRDLTLPPTWVYSYQYGKNTYNETIVGTAVGSDLSTTVPVYIIPVALVSGATTADPTVTTANGVSVIQNVLNSPLFQSTVNYTQEHISLGTTQYEDAVLRGSLFAAGAIEPGYHTLLGTPTVEPVQIVTLDSTDGKVIKLNKQNTILANEEALDSQLTPMIAALNIPTNALPIFVMTTAYLTTGTAAPTKATCCVGGYHSITSGGQPYAVATYITANNVFGENIDALSNVLGGWMFDPYVNNKVPAKCGKAALLEVGTPLRHTPNFGTYAYTVDGVTWNPQDLVTMPYFGVPSYISVNGWTTFQGQAVSFCSKGG